MKNKRLEVAKDKISSLPESLLHHILSFLDMHTVLQTMFLSTTWRHVWSSAPVLNFDSSLRKLNPNASHFVHFVDRFLHLRNNSTTIHRISLSSDYCHDIHRLVTWLFIALKQDVKEIHLTTYSSHGVIDFFLKTLFTSQIEVVNLTKILNLDKDPVQPMMKLMCSAPKLRTLELAYVALPEGDSSGKLILSYPVLEILILKFCLHAHLKVLQIFARGLKKLEIKNYYGKDSCSIELSTPNLESLQLVHSNYGGYSLGDLSSLTRAKIRVQETMPLFEVLQCLRNVTTLELCQLKIYAVSRKRFGQVFRSFSNLKRLILFRLHCGSCIHDMATLLNSATCIDTLVFSLSKGYRPINDEDDLEKMLRSGYRFHNLQYIRLLHSTYSEHELHILAFFLMSVKALKEMTIRAQVSNPIELAEFSKKLHLVPMASSNVSIHYM